MIEKIPHNLITEFPTFYNSDHQKIQSALSSATGGLILAATVEQGSISSYPNEEKPDQIKKKTDTKWVAEYI